MTNISHSQQQPHHCRQHYSLLKRRAHTGTRPSEFISTEALQHVVLRPQLGIQELLDSIGDCMTKLLNAHPDFIFDPTRETATAQRALCEYESFTFFPFKNHRNWLLLKLSCILSGSTRPMTLSLVFAGIWHDAPNRHDLLVKIDCTILLMISLVAAGSSSVVVMSNFALRWTAHAAVLLSVQVSLLTDRNGLEKLMPSQLNGFRSFLLAVGHLMDSYMFLRKQYAGREWNKDEFEFLNPLAAQSRHEQLWSLPPPSIQDAGRQICLVPRSLVWSKESSNHAVAIEFTYRMMREDYLRERARPSTQTHQGCSSSLSIDMERCTDLFHAPTQSLSTEDEWQTYNHQHEMSLSTKVGRRTECGFALTKESPPGGIEVVRDYFNRKRRDSNSLRLTTFVSSSLSNILVDTPTHAQSIRSDGSPTSSVSSFSSAVAAEMNWVDISARIGMRVLNSAHLQRVVASEETAERLKNITDQFVVSPKDKESTIQEPTAGLSSDYNAHSLKELAGPLGKSTSQSLSRRIPKSPCRPVHSMWTSAAAAAIEPSSEEESTIASLDARWKESNSFEVSEGPTAPPKIIRTPHIPSTAPTEVSRVAPVLPIRGLESAKHPPLRQHEGIMDFFLPEEASQHQSMFLKVSHEIIDLAHSNFTKCTDPSVLKSRERSYSPSHSGSHITERKSNERMPLVPGIKVAAPLFPLQPGCKRLGHSNYQMATVVSSKRIIVDTGTGLANGPANCLSVTCKVDKSFLRNGEFAELTFRVMDEWGSRYMPKHSKVPIGACVATAFGVGVVVGWRVEDDCHVIRSLWQRRGAGAAHAYLSRGSIHGVVEAAVGFEVSTKCGSGKVLGYVDAGRTFQNGRYLVTLLGDGVYKDCVVSLSRNDILACYGAHFIPVIEHIKEACNYQIMLDNYRAHVRQQRVHSEDTKGTNDHQWKFWPENLDILWKSFLKAVDEDSEFDEGIDSFMGSVIDFLESLDHAPPPTPSTRELFQVSGDDSSMGCHANLGSSGSEATEDQDKDPGFWILNDVLGGIFPAPGAVTRNEEYTSSDDASMHCPVDAQAPLDVSGTHARSSISYKRAFAVIRTLMKTVSLARAASAGKPQFCLAMTICREFLMFARTLVKVQQKNVSPQSLKVWRDALQEIISTFGPLKDRLEKIGKGVAQRMERQGRRAKIRVLRFADSILLDELFFNALCQGEWKECLVRIEASLVKARVIDEPSCWHYRKTAGFIYEHMMLLSSKESGALARNSKKLAKFVKFVQLIVSPKRSFLKLIRNDEVLEILERILVRVFCQEEIASRMLTIHATNFTSLRHLRILKDLSVSGRMWIPLLDAADAEFSFVVSSMPENAKELMCPLSSIFSLCVAQFHKISAGHSTKDWLDFLLEEDGVRIIHELDMKLILALSSFSRDVKDTMLIIPYYPNIDDDFLKLMDEVELDKLLKEASEAIDKADKLAGFIREKAARAIEQFLAYLPKLSIPVERRDLGEGWVLTVGQQGGGDLTLSDVNVQRENLVCEIMGRDALFWPIFGEDHTETSLAVPGSFMAGGSKISASSNRMEESILDHIREMILQARRHGSWTIGVGGVGKLPSDPCVASTLQDLPITSVLSCAIDLWRNVEIDDDELLEIAIRDVSYQIQLNKELEDEAREQNGDYSFQTLGQNKSPLSCLQLPLLGSSNFEDRNNRFNPQVNPTVLFLDMKNVTLHLERFRFRIEKGEKRTIFDPVFEGCGTVSIENLNILLRVECARERLWKVGSASVAPVLLLRELEADIEHVRLKVEDTGADWLLNKAVKGFSENITDIVESNLKERIQEQTKRILAQLNSYFLVNPDVLLNILGISLEDLPMEEHIMWV